MAQGKRITYDRLIDPNLMQRLLKELGDLRDKFQSATAGKATNVKEVNKALRDTVDVTEDLLRLQSVDLRLMKDINTLTDKQNRLRKVGKDLTKEQAAELTSLKVTRENNNRELKTEAKLVNTTLTSMNNLSQTLAKNKLEYRKLTDEERKNNKVGGQLLKTIKKQDKEIKKLDKTIGDTQRSVGDYGSAIAGAGSQFGIMGTAMNQMKGGFNVLKVGFRSVRAGIASTGIGLLILAFVALIKWFKGTEAGAAKLRRIMVPLNALWNAMTSSLQRLGEILSNVFNQSLLDTFKDMAGLVSDVSSKMFEQMRLAGNIAILQNQQHKARVRNLIDIAKLESEVAKQRLIARDETKFTLEEQIIASDIAKKATQELFKLKMQDAIFARSIAQEKSKQNQNSEDEAIALAEAEAVVIRLEKQRDDALRTITERQIVLSNKVITNKKQAAAAEAKMFANTQKLMEDDLDLFLKDEDEKEQRELDRLSKIGQAHIETTELITESQEEAAEIRIAAERQIQDALDESLSAGLQITKQFTDEWKIIAIAQASLNAYLAASQTLADFKTLDPIQKIAASLSVLAVGLGFVANMRAITSKGAEGLAEGTDEITGGVKGKDSVRKWMMPGEMVLKANEGAAVRALGISHNEVPGMVAIGQLMMNNGISATRIATEQLHAQNRTNYILKRGLSFTDDNGTTTSWNDNKIYRN